MSKVDQLITKLLESMTQTLTKLKALEDAHLDHECSHGCAMEDGVRGLLVHNIDHEKMHLGQIQNIRFGLKIMQRDFTDRLLAEWLRERAALASTLVGLSDDALNMKQNEDEWSIRETVEHTLYWERNSTEHLVLEQELSQEE